MKTYRSHEWYGKENRDGFIHRSWMKSQGFPDSVFDGRPVIGICNTASELNPCNNHLSEIAQYVKQGVWEAGGFPLVFPVISLGETQMRPTAMLFRNLLSMDVEECIRANPIDGVVLLGGCDKTTPGQLMGAASVDLPTIVVSSGPKLTGYYRSEKLGSGTDVWRFEEKLKAGEISLQELRMAESCMSRSHGTCMTMGTASTIACLVEVMGLALSGNGTLPAVDARRYQLAHETGKTIVQMVHKEKKLSSILTRRALENAIRLLSALGGSSNAVLHLLAIAGRLEIPLKLEDFDFLGRNIPHIVNLMPAGEYLMEDFHYAGGIPAVIKELAESFDLNVPTVSHSTLREQIQYAEVYNKKVILPRDKPLFESAGIRFLKGNLAPRGAIIKSSCASAHLLVHRGKAIVFENIEDYKARVDDPHLKVDENSILVLKDCGPVGYPGMPEVGNMALPKKLLQKGIRDLVRISDARMSGTAYGTVVLHVCPESSIGGPLAWVREGDPIRLDVKKGILELELPDSVIKERRLETKPKPEVYSRGYYQLYVQHVLQADQGADFDFLRGKSSDRVTRESH